MTFYANNTLFYSNVDAPLASLTKTLSTTWDTRETMDVYTYLYASWNTDNVLTYTTTTLVSPISLEKVPCLTPRFQITYDSDITPGQLYCQLRVSSDPSFSSQESWSPVTFLPANSLGEICRIPAQSSLVDNAVYYWGARAGYYNTWSEWSANGSFETDTLYGNGVQYGAVADVVTYSGADANPILWYLSDDHIDAGDQITAYGKWLAGAVEVNLNGEAIIPDSVTTVAGTADEFTADRCISETSKTTTLAHDEVVFTVPSSYEDDAILSISIGVE